METVKIYDMVNGKVWMEVEQDLEFPDLILDLPPREGQQ